MKKLLVFIFGAFAFFEFMVVANAATYQPTKLGWVDFSYSSGTITEICTSTPTTIGKPRFCTNCLGGGAAGTVCTSTSTSAMGAGCDFVLSTGTQCK